MRISDWTSDVCSSDLSEAQHGSLGMTETSGPHTMPPAAELGRPLREVLKGSFGAPVPFVEHRIADVATGATLDEGEVGELCVRGYSLMQGLYKQEREEVFDADRQSTRLTSSL